METTLYTSPSLRIGQHEWRCVVYQEDNAFACDAEGIWSLGHTRRFTRYEWRRVHSQEWRTQYDWPTYDGDHCDGGMPRTLARLYYRYEEAIQTALGRLPKQLTLPL